MDPKTSVQIPKGNLITDTSGRTWRIVDHAPASEGHGYVGRRYVDGSPQQYALTTREIASTAAPPEYAVNEAVFVEAAEGRVLEKYAHSREGHFYLVRFGAEPQPWCRQSFREEWVHGYAIDIVVE
jgi:hypothetical protein